MIRLLSILGIMLCLNNISHAQNPSNTPCTASVVQASNVPGTFNNKQISVCCASYTNFLGGNPTCGTAQTNRDAWYKIEGMTAGQTYNFMYIETGNRQTWVEIFELPAGKDCSVPADYVSVKCARANNVAFFPGSTVSATFTPPNAASTYYVRFQRSNVTDEALEGTFSVTKSYQNEEPCTALPLQVQPAQGTSPTFGNNITAADWKPEILTGPTCGPNNDVWYKFVATSCSMQVFVDNLAQTTFEMQASILASADGTCNNLMEVTPCGGQPDQYLDIMLTADNLTVGKTYYVIVDGFSPPYINAVGNFSIEVFNKPNAGPCLNIPSPCDCGDALTCGGTVLPNSAAGNAALNAAAANPASNGCFNFAQSAPPAPALCGGNNTVEFCTKYTALSSDTLIAFDNVVNKDAACEVLSTKNVAYEEGLCADPINPVCLDFNKKSPVFKVAPGKTYRFCRQVVTNGSDPDCLGKTYQSFCAFLWKIPSNYSITRTICNGETFTFGGNNYSASGNYSANFTSTATGCDSTVHLNLIVLPAANQVITTSICNGDSYKIGAKTYDKSGTYTEKIKTANGCDSTITLNLTVLPSKVSSISKSICFGETLTIGTKIFDKSGVYTISVKTSGGLTCDSTINLTLTVDPKIQTVNKQVVCNGATYTSPVTGTVYDATGIYNDKVFKAANGCDSTYIIDLTVLGKIATTLNEGICNGSKYQLGTQTLTTAGTYTEVFKTKLGCDSTVTLTLKVGDKVDKTINATTCDNQPYTLGTDKYTKSGQYIKIFKAVGGCDSTVTLNLTANPTYNSNLSITKCDGESYTFDGTTYTTNTTKTATFKTKNGCDSTVALTLTFLPKNEKSESRTICNGQSVVVNGVTYTKAGTYPVYKGKDKNGCDSTFTVTITEETINLAVSQKTEASCGGKSDGAAQVTSPTSGVTYLWSNGVKTAEITNVPKGTYTVTVTNTATGCTKSASVTVSEAAAPPPVADIQAPSCGDNKSDGSITITSAATKYQWSNGATTKALTGLKAGATYSVTVTTADECTATSSFVVPQPQAPVLTVTPSNVSVNLGFSTTVQLTVTPALANPSFTWSPSLNVVAGASNSFAITPTKIGSSVYSVTVTLSNGCTAKTDVTVIGVFNVPHVIIPDGTITDDKDFIPVVKAAHPSYKKFVVFNRWSEVVYDDPTLHKWDGTFNDKKCPPDVYKYIIEIDSPNPNVTIEPIKGEVTILR